MSEYQYDEHLDEDGLRTILSLGEDYSNLLGDTHLHSAATSLHEEDVRPMGDDSTLLHLEDTDDYVHDTIIAAGQIDDYSLGTGKIDDYLLGDEDFAQLISSTGSEDENEEGNDFGVCDEDELSLLEENIEQGSDQKLMQNSLDSIEFEPSSGK